MMDADSPIKVENVDETLNTSPKRDSESILKENQFLDHNFYYGLDEELRVAYQTITDDQRAEVYLPEMCNVDMMLMIGIGRQVAKYKIHLASDRRRRDERRGRGRARPRPSMAERQSRSPEGPSEHDS